MLPWSLWAENIFLIFEVRDYPSIYDFGLEVSPENTISEGRPPRPFATQARKRDLSIQEVRIENDLDRKFSKSKFFKVFLKTTFLHDSCCITLWPPRSFHPHGRFTTPTVVSLYRPDDTGGAAHSCAAGHTTYDKIHASSIVTLFIKSRIFFSKLVKMKMLITKSTTKLSNWYYENW